MGTSQDRPGAWERLEAGALAARERFLPGRRLVWATSILVSLLAWQLSFGVPAPGLDSSWMGGLYMALREGKDFGNEIVFTYGPLGFLDWPSLWYSWLAVLAFIFSAAIYVSFTATLVWTLRRNLGLVAAAVVAFLYLATIIDSEQLPLLLAIGWSFVALRDNRPAAAVTLLVVGGGSLSAVETLVKLSVGPPIFLICVLALIGARADRRQWALFSAIFFGGLVALWLIAGQALGSLPDYAKNGAQVISGYNEAMAIDASPNWEAAALVAIAFALVVVSARARFRDSRAHRLGVALTALAAFITFKYGVVRFEPGHVTLAISAMLGLWLLIPWPPKTTALFMTTSVAVAAIMLHAYPAQARLDVIANLRNFGKSVEILVRPGRRQQIVDQSRASLQSLYALDPATLAQVKGKKVEVDPWEIAVAWAYKLDWSPLPVFQNYTAYTSSLDRLNAEAVENPNGPQVILRENMAGVDPLNGGSRGFEGRLPAWDPPEQNVAIVCNFAPAHTAANWQVLGRTPNRCSPPKLATSISARPGEAIEVPQAGPHELVILRLGGVGVEGLERLKSLFWRPRSRYAVLNGGDVTYRLVPATAGDGLIVSRDPALDSEGAFAQLPAVTDIAIEGASGPLHFDFYRVRVQVPPEGPKGRVAGSTSSDVISASRSGSPHG